MHAIAIEDRKDPALIEARNIMARPNIHSNEVVTEACVVARRIGDWMDVDRAERLLDALRIETQAKSEQAEEIQIVNALVWGAIGAVFILYVPFAASWIIKAGGKFVGLLF